MQHRLFLLFSLLITTTLQATSIDQWTTTQLVEKPSFRASGIGYGKIWVAGTQGKVFISENYAKSWIDVSLKDGFKGDIRDIALFNKDTAIIMSAGSGDQSRLYLTQNAGKNWQLLLKNTHKKGFFNSIDFWDEKNGLLLGDPVDGFYVVLKTNDGGKSWQRVPKSNLPTILNKEAAFAASGNTLVTQPNGQAWITTGGFSASAYYSSDYGKTWTRFTVPIHHKTQTSGGYALANNSLNRIFVVGGDYLDRPASYNNIAVFNNKTRQFDIVNSGQHGLRTAMSCQQKTCLLTGKTGTEVSYNNGRTWRQHSKEGFYTLASDAQHFIAAGHDGRVGIIQLKKKKKSL
ncbi:WD40/YVTN/BNR-like repeat-containing protein [Aliikangiella sp. IMCC44359]|uniref:WD40/YVTN/BNR-like repeat-containing protein n=1 Tax=Aliikangiella sp. IMCC44359 TaxID=3459125 RepID=UPI00403AE0A8